MDQNTQTIKIALEKGATIKLIGDSITAGGGSSDNDRSGEVFINIGGVQFRRQLGRKCWASLLASHIQRKFPKSNVINNGCSNITSTHVKDNIKELYNDSDDIVIIMIGTNDRKQRNGMEVLYNNLRFTARYFEQKEKTTILMSPNPSTAKNQDIPSRLYTLSEVNSVIKRVSDEEKVRFISNFDYINNYLLNSNRTIEDLMVGKNEKLDGLHPSDEAHYLIYKNIIQALSIE
jgi:lysophospholipase L1-like esterase